MSYAKLRAELLAAREAREELRLNTAQHTAQTLLQLGLNLPGTDKSPPGATELFRWALQQLESQIPFLDILAQGEDPLGPWALLSTPLEASASKQRTLKIETRNAAARLLDIDVYAPQGPAIGRRELELPARGCLLCDQAAVDCIRLKNHPSTELKVRTDELLAPFRA